MHENGCKISNSSRVCWHVDWNNLLILNLKLRIELADCAEKRMEYQGYHRQTQLMNGTWGREGPRRSGTANFAPPSSRAWPQTETWDLAKSLEKRINPIVTERTEQLPKPQSGSRKRRDRLERTLLPWYLWLEVCWASSTDLGHSSTWTSRNLCMRWKRKWRRSIIRRVGWMMLMSTVKVV